MVSESAAAHNPLLKVFDLVPDPQAMFGPHILSVLIFFPIALAIGLMVFDDEDESQIWTFAFAGSVIEFLLSLHLLWHHVPSASMQFLEHIPWVPRWGINYIVGADGFSIPLIVLATLLTPIVLASSVTSVTKMVRLYAISFLVLESAMIGSLVALDLFLFYVFWELMLIPMFLIIGIWGGKRRIYATVKFVLYTIFGSLLMLVAILALAKAHFDATGILTFDVMQLWTAPVSPQAQVWMFGAFALAFAIKVPLFPFHTWLPDAHVEAPTGGSVILAGVLLKLGGYGMIRFAFPLFPHGATTFAGYLLFLAAMGIIYGALISRVQPDLKKLVAYSSVSHLGFAVLGIASGTEIGLIGAVVGMISHGLTTGGLFLMVGMIYERRHTRELDEFGGLMESIPAYSQGFRFMTLASVGLPGLSGFVGEFLVFIGAFQAGGASRLAAVVSTPVLILSAVYLLWMYQKVCLGPLDKDENRDLEDLTCREKALLTPLVILILVLGIFPQTVVRTIQPSAHHLAQSFEKYHFGSAWSYDVPVLESHGQTDDHAHEESH